MDLIPKAMVVGVFVPPAPPGQQQVSADRINRIWAELAPAHGFTSLQMAPDGSVANFVGRTGEDGITIQPPLIQIRSSIETSTSVAAETVESMVKVITRHLNAPQIFNVGIRHVYVAPLPDNDARGFVLHRLLRSDEQDLASLSGDPDHAWGGLKYLIPLADRQYTLVIEPSVLEEMRSLYIDLDAQFPGQAVPGAIAERAQEAQDYLTGVVNQYLDQRAELQ